MMTLDEVLIQIKNRGIEMRADGDELQCRPKEALTSELRSAMRTHKLELLERLLDERAEEGYGADFEHLLGFSPTQQAEENILNIMRVFDGELLHRWDTGQIVEKDRLLDFLVYRGNADVELDPEGDVQTVDLSELTAANIGDVIDAILTVLLVVCSDPDDKATVLQGRLGFCDAFDDLPYDIRKGAVKIAHDHGKRPPGLSGSVQAGFPAVRPDDQHPGRYIAYRVGSDARFGHGETDIEALDDLERQERERLSPYAAPRAQSAGSVGNGKQQNATGIN